MRSQKRAQPLLARERGAFRLSAELAGGKAKPLVNRGLSSAHPGCNPHDAQAPKPGTLARCRGSAGTFEVSLVSDPRSRMGGMGP